MSCLTNFCCIFHFTLLSVWPFLFCYTIFFWRNTVQPSLVIQHWKCVGRTHVQHFFFILSIITATKMWLLRFFTQILFRLNKFNFNHLVRKCTSHTQTHTQYVCMVVVFFAIRICVAVAHSVHCTKCQPIELHWNSMCVVCACTHK